MNKKMIKLLTVTVLAIVLVAAMATVAFATATKPYSSYNVSRTSSRGEAVIYKCSCNPVDNYLSASCRIQYLDAQTGTYMYTNWSTSSGYNSPGRVSSWTVYDGDTVNYVQGQFQARCGEGSIKYYSKSY